MEMKSYVDGKMTGNLDGGKDSTGIDGRMVGYM